MKHSNALILEKIYEDFQNGNIDSMLRSCDEKITFQVAGKSKLAGKFTKENFKVGFFDKLSTLSDGTFKLEIHDVLASDRHGIVLASNSFTRAGEKVELRTVHVWRFENGKPVAWYEYPRDLYRFDQVWA
jgi:ketosteroid isomerase-like protein